MSDRNADPFAALDKEIGDELAGMSETKTNSQNLEQLLLRMGFGTLKEGSSLDDVGIALRALRNEMAGKDRLWIALAREAAIIRLQSIGIRAPAAIVDAAVNDITEEDSSFGFVELLPWPESVAGSDLLNEIANIFCKYVILSSYDATALALWTVLTYMTETTHILPLLVISSPEKRCGKTLVLEIIQGLSLRPLPASNISSASLYRIVEKFRPTLLIDEADTFLSENEELRGIINAGHRRSFAFVLRCDGEEKEPRQFSTWCSKAIAMIGDLADTIEDRAIIIRMRRKAPNETIQRFRLDKITVEFEILRRKAARWARDASIALKESDPATPPELNDRSADNWRPLLAIADIAGKSWPALARESAISISGSANQKEQSVRTQLLEDIAKIFAENRVEKISSDELCKALAEMEERPWPEWRKGKPISPRQVAKLLRPFNILPRQTRIGMENVRRYHLEDIRDTLSRYTPDFGILSATALQPNNDAGLSGFSNALQKGDCST